MKITNPKFDLKLILGQEPYTRKLSFGHMPDYLKAKANAELYKVAIYHCIKMECSQIAKGKMELERDNKDKAEEYWQKAQRWCDRYESALDGKPDEFFLKMNNMPINEND